MKSINIKDIAKAAGVGVSTVSRVLNDQPDVSETTKEKVLKVIEELNYVPNNSARNLKRNKTNHIGVFVIGEYSTFLSEVIEAVEKKISAAGYTLVIHFQQGNDRMLEKAVQFTLEKRLIGLIYLGGVLNKKDEGFLKQLNIPVVFGSTVIDSDVDKGLYNSVTIDNYTASCSAVEALISKGHQKIGLISVNGNDPVANRRQLAYTDTMSKHGLEVDDTYIAYGNFSMKSGYEAALQLKDTDITALFSVADMMAIGALKAFSDHKKMVPEDISIIGFDGLELTDYTVPSLASVEQPSQTMGFYVADLIIDKMSNEIKEQIVLETRLKEGNSLKELS